MCPRLAHHAAPPLNPQNPSQIGEIENRPNHEGVLLLEACRRSVTEACTQSNACWLPVRTWRSWWRSIPMTPDLHRTGTHAASLLLASICGVRARARRMRACMHPCTGACMHTVHAHECTPAALRHGSSGARSAPTTSPFTVLHALCGWQCC